MDVKEAIASAKQYLTEIYADENVSDLALEEIEHFEPKGQWTITVAFSRPWTTPRTRAQEILENLGAVSPQRRSVKVITMANDGTVLSVKDRAKAESAL